MPTFDDRDMRDEVILLVFSISSVSVVPLIQPAYFLGLPVCLHPDQMEITAQTRILFLYNLLRELAQTLGEAHGGRIPIVRPYTKHSKAEVLRP